MVIIVRYVSMSSDADTPRDENYGGVIAIVFLLAVIYMVAKYFVYLGTKADERARKPNAEESVAIDVE